MRTLRILAIACCAFDFRLCAESGASNESAAEQSLDIPTIRKNLEPEPKSVDVLIRESEYRRAEEILRKAVAEAPADANLHRKLGVVYFAEAKYDDAVNEFAKALAIDPKNATAHNYLGIIASQKGRSEAAQKELETAVALDPDYADAHFNLAVFFATQTLPNKKSAREHYARALALGAERDASLEFLIKGPDGSDGPAKPAQPPLTTPEAVDILSGALSQSREAKVAVFPAEKTRLEVSD